MHAGWKGALQGVACKALEIMRQEFSTDFNNLRVFFGPSIKPCCYKVRDDFVKQFATVDYAGTFFCKRGNDIFFDLPGFNKAQLEKFGLSKESFLLDYNFCTACNEQFCSNRRDGKSAGRQMTVISLK